jgi:hypothetical protein
VRAFSTCLLLLCALALAIAVVGCGGDSGDDRDDDAAEIREKAAALEAAFDARDPDAYCSLLAPSYIEEVGGQAACRKQQGAENGLMMNAEDTDMSVVNIDFEENGEEATAYLANKGFQYYLKEDGEWYPTLFTE